MKSVSDNDNKGERSEPNCECHIWGKNHHKLKKKKNKTDNPFQVCVCCVYRYQCAGV